MKTKIKTVFIVDDDASARIGLGRLIRIAGYDVKLFADASAFLKEVSKASNACVVLDLRMPGLSGINLQKKLASRGTFIPVIMVTADESPEIRCQAKQAGAVAFFRKPVDGPALLDAIAWAVGECEQ